MQISNTPREHLTHQIQNFWADRFYSKRVSCASACSIVACYGTASSRIVLRAESRRGFDAHPADSTFWISAQILDLHFGIVKYCNYDTLPFQRRGGGFATMFKNTFQSGFLSILYSIGSKPLQIWDKKVCVKSIVLHVCNLQIWISFQVRNGHIKRITDQDIQSFVLEIVGTNVSTTYITCPAGIDHFVGTIGMTWNSLKKKHLKQIFVQTQRRHWGSSFPTLWWSSRIWKSISPLRFR